MEILYPLMEYDPSIALLEDAESLRIVFHVPIRIGVTPLTLNPKAVNLQKPNAERLRWG